MHVSAGKVILDFHGNINIKEKRKQMELLLKELHKGFNVSALEIDDFEDLERCVIGLALCAGTAKGAEAAMRKVLDHIDANAFARVAVEDTDEFAFD